MCVAILVIADVLSGGGGGNVHGIRMPLCASGGWRSAVVVVKPWCQSADISGSGSDVPWCQSADISGSAMLVIAVVLGGRSCGVVSSEGSGAGSVGPAAGALSARLQAVVLA